MPFRLEIALCLHGCAVVKSVKTSFAGLWQLDIPHQPIPDNNGDIAVLGQQIQLNSCLAKKRREETGQLIAESSSSSDAYLCLPKSSMFGKRNHSNVSDPGSTLSCQPLAVRYCSLASWAPVGRTAEMETNPLEVH